MFLFPLCSSFPLSLTPNSDCFIYTNTAGRLNYYIGGEVQTLAHLSKAMYLLGYLTKENRVYLMDKAHNMYSYTLLLSTLIYQTAIVRRDFDAARKALSAVPASELNKLARFLEGQDLKEMALGVSQDPEHRFELAMSCKKLALARGILQELGDSGSEAKWKALGDAALSPPAGSAPEEFDLALAEEAYTKAGDLGGLLLIHSSLADAGGLAKLAERAEASGRNNVAFLCYFLLHRVDRCVSLLVGSDRIPEAAFLTRTYAPASIPRILAVWKENLAKVSAKAAEALADPGEYPELFPDLGPAVQVQAYLAATEGELLPSILYGDYAQNISRALVADMKEGRIDPPSQQEVQQLLARAKRPLGAEEEEAVSEQEEAPVAAPAPVAAAPVAAPTPAFTPAFVPAPVAAAPAPAAFVAAPASVPSPTPAPAAAAASFVKPASPAPVSPTTPASAASSPANVFAGVSVFPGGTSLHVNASSPSPASAVTAPATNASATSTPAAQFTPMSSTTSSAAAASPSPAAAAFKTPAVAAASPFTRTTAPAASPAAASPAASASVASPLYSSSASASPLKAAAVPVAVASAVTAAAPKPAVVTPKAVVTPTAAPAAASAPKPFAAAVPAPAPAADLNLSGDEDDDLTSPVGKDAPVPSLDDINASLAEIDGGDDDFGDFE